MIAEPNAQQSSNDGFKIGILAMEVYFPLQYVSQQELERYDGVSEGKYTIGLQQQSMAFVDQTAEGGEDSVSMALTCVQSLLDKYFSSSSSSGGGSGNDSGVSADHYVDVACIGRIEVGTETPIDKSKSIKTHLMQLLQQTAAPGPFEEGIEKRRQSQFCFVEGCDTINACYGGTNALFNAVYFLESHYQRQKRHRRMGKEKPMYALVVCTDIAQYGLDNTSARATGGAGACAMLLGVNAPLVIDLDLKCSFSQDTYDFWKGDPMTPVPDFDGHMSNMYYLKALDNCYKKLRKIHEEIRQYDPRECGRVLNLDYFDYLVFHTPYNKLVQKALGRLLYNDLIAKRKHDGGIRDSDYQSLGKLLTELESEVDMELDKIREFLSLSRRETYYNSDLHKTFRKLSQQHYQSKVIWSTLLSKELGNTYTASLYMSLASLVYQCGDPEHGLDKDKSILMYSYGSGFCSSMFVIRTRRPTGDSPFTIERMRQGLQLDKRLSMRKKVPPDQFDTVQHNNLLFYRRNNYEIDSQEAESKLFPGTFYLRKVDSRWRRFYTRKSTETEELKHSPIRTTAEQVRSRL